MADTYTVGDVMVRDVLTVEPHTKLLDCAKKMAEKKVGCLVIVIDDQVKGMLTEQDLARKVVAQEIDAKETPVSEIMSVQITTITPDRDIRDALQLMGTNEIKHLPVLVDNKLAGIITFKDIIKIEPALIELLSFKSAN